MARIFMASVMLFGVMLFGVMPFGVMLAGAAEIISKRTTACPAHNGLVAHQLYPLIKAVDKANKVAAKEEPASTLICDRTCVGGLSVSRALGGVTLLPPPPTIRPRDKWCMAAVSRLRRRHEIT